MAVEKIYLNGRRNIFFENEVYEKAKEKKITERFSVSLHYMSEKKTSLITMSVVKTAIANLSEHGIYLTFDKSNTSDSKVIFVVSCKACFEKCFKVEREKTAEKEESVSNLDKVKKLVEKLTESEKEELLDFLVK